MQSHVAPHVARVRQVAGQTHTDLAGRTSWFRWLVGALHLSAALLIVVLGAVSACQRPPASRDLCGKVVRILDGDSLVVLVASQQMRVRLHGIDCPERGQPYHTRAREFAAGLAFGKEVVLVPRGRDRYGRTIAEIKLADGRYLSREVVRAGLAWWYQKYAPDDAELKLLEDQARMERRGLWAEPAPVPPWNWRSRAKVTK